MSRATTVRAVRTPVVFGTSGWLVATPPSPRPGPDLRGAQIGLEARAGGLAKAGPQTTDQPVEARSRRVDEQAEPTKPAAYRSARQTGHHR